MVQSPGNALSHIGLVPKDRNALHADQIIDLASIVGAPHIDSPTYSDRGVRRNSIPLRKPIPYHRKRARTSRLTAADPLNTHKAPAAQSDDSRRWTSGPAWAP